MRMRQASCKCAVQATQCNPYRGKQTKRLCGKQATHHDAASMRPDPMKLLTQIEHLPLLRHRGCSQPSKAKESNFPGRPLRLRRAHAQPHHPDVTSARALDRNIARDATRSALTMGGGVASASSLYTARCCKHRLGLMEKVWFEFRTDSRLWCEREAGPRE